jgi:serine/threonine protein kinase
MFKKLRGNQSVDRSKSSQAVAGKNISGEGEFKQRVAKSVFQDNRLLKWVGNLFKKLDKPIDGFRNVTEDKTKNLIKTQSASQSTKATRAKDTVPELIRKAPELFFQTKKFFNPNIGENKQENIAEGGFGVVQHAYAKSIFPDQNISRLFVKKKLKTPHPVLIGKERMGNLKAGIYYKLDEEDNGIVTEYAGETLEKLFIAEEMDIPSNVKNTDKRNKNKINPYTSKKMSFETKVSLAQQLLTELSKLHKKCIVHADIKPHNLVVNSKGRLSIIDFGGMPTKLSDTSNDPDQDVILGPHTERFAPPEISNNSLINNRYDSWSAGQVIYRLFTGKDLLEGVSEPGVWDQQKRETLAQNIRNNVTDNPNIPQEAKTLIYTLLDLDPKTRISTTDALKLDLFTNQELHSKPSLIALSAKHDEKFKELASLEHRLEIAVLPGTELYKELEARIKDLASEIKKLQEEINKF